MKERPILMSGPLVRETLADRKTVTRRIAADLRVVPRRDVGSDLPSVVFGMTGAMGRAADDAIGNVGISGGMRYRAGLNPHGAVFAELGDEGRLGLRPGEFDFVCPYADGRTYLDAGRWHIDVAPDQRLWVRETWAAPHRCDHLPPRRIQQGERVHYGATEDLGGLLGRPSIFMPRWASRLNLAVSHVRLEHLQDITEDDAIAEGVDGVAMDDVPRQGTLNRRDDFGHLWDRINGKRAPWSSNPWVWAISFRRVDGEVRS